MSVDFALLLRLEHAVADILATPEPAGRPVLDAIGRALGWSVGAMWQVTPGGLRCVATWSTSDRFAAFETATRDLVLARGEGLPGAVWQRGEPAWVREFGRQAAFPRAAAAGEAGLSAAFCFPLRSAEGVEGIVEFFTSTLAEPPPDLLSTAKSLGRRIGDALHRARAADEVRRSEARLRAVLDSALDCVVIADADGVVLEFNPAACQTFGYRRDEAVGRELAELIVPPALREAHRQGLRRLLASGEPRLLDQRVETTGRRADGTEFPVELTITRVAVAGPAVFSGYLRDLSDKHRVAEELKASRRRVLEAAVGERQRLERDLHDGAQQRLVGLGMTLARARTALPDQPARAAAILDDAIAALEESAIELRDLARGIHPASLTRYGLGAALADMARRSPVELRLGELPADRFPPAVEATAYFVVSEAVTNVARYAGTGTAHVDVAVSGAELVVTVTDGGRGGADAGLGSGLRGLADRIALLDGTLTVDSPAGAGTTVRASIPL
ncbi:PAS domain S-box protein [Dactylosporangium sp. NPDC049742]|uniref:PAS domain S-box protein n=1 Tax=Dactylosporangium sp. NPDC049742 TaxID=3154737 RepID=UPI0034182833